MSRIDVDGLAFALAFAGGLVEGCGTPRAKAARLAAGRRWIRATEAP